MILCEGYTDTIALHQAGMRNAVGLMGTALTAEQVGELARMAQTVLLALDADAAGQEAMLRAASVAARRRLELRVVPLPEGRDPAELIAARRRRGDARRGGAARCRSCASAWSGCSRRATARAPEGRDRILEELRPVFATMAPSAMPHGAAAHGLERARRAGEPDRARAARGRAAARPGRAAAAGRARTGAAAERRRGERGPGGAVAQGGDRAGVPGAVHRLARGGGAGARASSTSRSTSRAGCCGGRRAICGRAA